MSLIRKLRLFLAAIGLILLGLYWLVLGFNAETDLSQNLYILISVIALSCGGALWMFASPSTFNSAMDTTKIVKGTSGISMAILYEAFKDLETSLGKPWLGEMKLVKGPVMFFGPNVEGQYIYLYPLGEDTIQISLHSMTKAIKAPLDEQWRLSLEQSTPDSIADIVRFKFGAITMLPELVDKLCKFRDTKEIDLTPVKVDSNVDVYLFEEAFKWFGQDFYLSDTEGNNVLRISAPMPCKTFTITDVQCEDKLFRLTKRILHILPHYDLYQQEQKMGRIKKKWTLLRKDYFVANTADGTLELKKVNGMFGDNYQVILDGRLIGTIAEKLNLTLSNMVFDNFVMTVNNPKYLTLMTAMAVMAAREEARDSYRNISDADDLAFGHDD